MKHVQLRFAGIILGFVLSGAGCNSNIDNNNNNVQKNN